MPLDRPSTLRPIQATDASGASAALLARPANAAALARARGEFTLHERAFRAFEAHALASGATGRFLEAAAWAQVACYYGWSSPGGVLVAPALEGLLNELGRNHVPGDPRARIPTGDPRRVLHVMTECYEVGGHTRIVERWIERDAARRATVVLLNQHVPIPAAFTAALLRGGANLLPRPDGDIFARARALRTIAVEHDLVVLHVHMHDVVPALAFADPTGRPPVIYFEHASHQLWVGAGCADIVACFRELEIELAATRRGLGHERTRLLPLPIASRTLPERADARRSIGVHPDALMVLSVASPWKIRPVLEPTFSEIVAAAAAASPEARFFVAGPKPGPEWAETLDRFGDRVLLLGPVPDLGPLLASADVYLDSWPATGGTTLLDVADAGVPIVSLGDAAPDVAMIRPNDRALDGAVVRARDVGELGQRVADLLAAPAERASLGALLRAAVHSHHGEGWTAYLERVVQGACERKGQATPPTPVAPVPAAGWECVLRLLLAEEHAVSPARAIMNNAHDFPTGLLPADAVDAEHFARAVFASEQRGRRVLAQPVLEAAAVVNAVEQMRRLWAAGNVDRCIVAIHPDRLSQGMALLQAALDVGGDLEIEVVPLASLAQIVVHDDVVIN